MLDLIKVELDGWLSYNKAIIPLNESGITLIQGKTGSGKSAIFEAVSYLLFGQVLRKKDSVENLVNKVTNKGYDISLELCRDDKRAIIREVRGRKDDDLYFTVNGVDKRGKKIPDTRKNIIDFVGMSFDEFKSIAFLGQRQSQQLVEGTNASRAEVISEVFGLEKYNNIIDLCSTDLKKLDLELNSIDISLVSKTDDLHSLEESIKDQEFEDIDPSAIEVFDSKIEKVESKLRSIRERQTSINILNSRYESIKKKSDRRIALMAELESLLAKIDSFKDYNIDPEALSEELSEYNSKKTERLVEIRRLNNELKELEKFVNNCPITKESCPINVPEEYKGKRHAACTSSLNELTGSLNKVEDSIKECGALLSGAKQYNSISVQINSKKEILGGIEIEELPDIENQNIELSKCLEGISKGSAVLSELKKEKDNILISKARKEQYEKTKKEVACLINNRKQEIEKLDNNKQQLIEEQKYIMGVLNLFKKAKIYRIDAILELMNKNIDENLNKISDGTYKAYFVSQKTDSKGKRAIDNLDILVNDGYKVISIGMVSGGQLAQVSLSVLLAVWKSAYEISNKSISSLWLDEVFGPLDTTIVNRILGTIVEITKEIGTRSVKIISHKELDLNLADHLWETTRENGISSLEILS